jgi:hypothetical protein
VQRLFIHLTELMWEGFKTRRLLRFVQFVAFGTVIAALNTASAYSQALPASSTSTVHQGDLTLSVSAGVGKVEISYFSGAWVPFRISISNQGPAIAGRLVVRCPSSDGPSQQFREYLKEVQVPTGSEQFHEIAAFVSSGEDAQVRLVTIDGEVAAETAVKIERTYGISDLEVAVVDSDQTALGNIAQTTIDKTPNRPPFGKRTPGGEVDPSASNPTQQRRVRGFPFAYASQNLTAKPSVVAVEDLPRDYISYDQIDVLVLGDAPVNQMSEDQARALRLWVASGGLFIVTGGADFAGLNATGLASLLPVEARGNVTRNSPLAGLSDIYGAFEGSDSLVLMNAVAMPGARVLVGGNENVFVAERNYGSGLVRFVAINPEINPYRAWIGARELWADLLLPAAEVKPRNSNWITFGRRAASGSSRFGVQGFLFRLAEIAPPSPSYILLFLFFYVLCVGPINYALLKWKKRTDLAWITIPAVVLLFTAVSVIVAQQSRGGSSILADASLVEIHQRDGLAKISSGLLMVPSSKGTQEVTFEGGGTYANDVYQGSQSSSAAAGIEGLRSGQSFVLRVPMTTWTSSLFQVRSIVDGARGIVSVEYGSDGSDSARSVLSLTNKSDLPLLSAVCLSSGGVSEPFDLSPGATRNVELASPQPMPFDTWYASKLTQSSDQADLFQDVGGLLDKEIGGEPVFSKGFFDKLSMAEACGQLERPLLVCFVDNNPTVVNFNGVFKRRSKAFYVIHL